MVPGTGLLIIDTGFIFLSKSRLIKEFNNINMRLLTKTTLYFLLVMVPLLAAGGFYLFRQFSNELNQRVDQELIYEAVQWKQYLQNETFPGTVFTFKSPDLFISPVNSRAIQYPYIADTYGFKAGENYKVPFRQLVHIVAVNGINYQIIIRKSQEQKTALMVNVTWLMLVVFAGLFIATLVFNWLINKNLWKPFRVSLDKIRKAELQKMEGIHFEKTNIVEFNELNESLNSMTNKIYNDYVNMKEFTENSAHEMQTPLAVVQSKLELLLQDSNLTDEQVYSIMQATESLNRLNKLNQALLLLAKIENKQYETNETVSLASVTKKYLQLFEEIIQDKQVTVETHFINDWQLSLHPLLAESLVSNLIGNAVKYNHKGGSLTIWIEQNKFRISNTSHYPAIEPSQLFKRFNKASDNKNSSTGLGLAIVKKIADTHNLVVSYKAEDELHEFVLEKK